MNELRIPGTLDSREVAEMIGKDHKHLLADIRTYISYMEGGEPKIRPSDFFIESTYQSEQNKTMPCYLVTKKGCEMIANKLTGAKGIQFTADYVTRFHAMESAIKDGADGILDFIANAGHNRQMQNNGNDKLLRAQAMLMNAQTRQFNAIMKSIQDKTKLSAIAVEVFGIKALGAVTGAPVGDYLPQTEKHFSATEVGKKYGVTAARVGRLANENGLKVSEFGQFVMDKSPYSSKQVEAFRYNSRGVERIGQLLGIQ